MRANQPYNYTHSGNNDMYGAGNPGMYGAGNPGVYAAGNPGYRPNQNVSYGQGQTNLGNTGQSFEYSATNLNANKHNRPPVASEGGCCCSVM